MNKFIELIAKTWTCIMDDDNEHKKAKEQRSV